ncbi:MAG: hypothetical protein E7643_02700 [Ruminococcaceae bacterium]|nr:hypothetical protein [Oscillospiraceae bacterium]
MTGKGSHKGRLQRFFACFVKKARANKISFAVYAAMGGITTAVIALTFLSGHYESTFTAVLSLFLFLLPTFVEESFRIKLPASLEIVAVLFVFCANILGEIAGFYIIFPFWDDMLHYTSGFIFAAFGFSLVELLNRHTRFDFYLSPIFISLVALFFAMTVGVMWEFFEFSADMLLGTDMQKDFTVENVNSILLGDGETLPVRIHGIEHTVIVTESGEEYVIEGYLDIGLLDTMKDLFVDFLGALFFCIIGFFYTSRSSKGRIARRFIPRVDSAE